MQQIQTALKRDGPNHHAPDASSPAAHEAALDARGREILPFLLPLTFCPKTGVFLPKADAVAFGAAAAHEAALGALWLLPDPTVLPRAVVSFRDDTSVNGQLTIVWLILVRWVHRRRPH